MSKHALEALEQVAPLIGSALGRLRFSVPADASILPIIIAAIANEKEDDANIRNNLLAACRDALALLEDPDADAFQADTVEATLRAVIAEAGGGK